MPSTTLCLPEKKTTIDVLFGFTATTTPVQPILLFCILAPILMLLTPVNSPQLNLILVTVRIKVGLLTCNTDERLFDFPPENNSLAN